HGGGRRERTLGADGRDRLSVDGRSRTALVWGQRPFEVRRQCGVGGETSAGARRADASGVVTGGSLSAAVAADPSVRKPDAANSTAPTEQSTPATTNV